MRANNPYDFCILEEKVKGSHQDIPESTEKVRRLVILRLQACIDMQDGHLDNVLCR